MRGSREMRNQFKWIMAVLLMVIFLLPLSFSKSAEIYQWKDKDGTIVFSDTPPLGGGVEIKKIKEDPTLSAKPQGNISKTKSEGIREKRSYGDINIIMYTTSWCGYCRKAREYIRSLHVHLMEYDIEKDRNKREEMLKKSGGSTGVPLIDVEGILIRGYGPTAIKEAVERRRSL